MNRPNIFTLTSILERYYALAVICVAGLTYLTFSPGMTSYDSFIQALEALSGEYHGWHPPMMSWLWGVFIRYLWADYSVMLAFHLSLFWGAVYVLGLTVIRGSLGRAYLLLLVCLIPPVMAMISVIWKDTGMTVSWFLACALMIHSNAENKPPSGMRSAMIVTLLFYGLAVRYNALFALLPLCYWFAACFLGLRRRILANFLLGLLLLFGLLFANNVVTRVLVRTPHLYEEMKANRQLVVLRHIRNYSGVEMNQNMVSVDSVSKEFIERISTHPSEYFIHRWERFKQQQGLGSYAPSYPYGWGETSRYSQLQALSRRYIVEATCAAKDPNMTIQDAFVRMYLEHPLSSLGLHWERFRRLLRLGEGTSCYPFAWDEGPEDSIATRKLAHYYLKAMQDSFWFKGWLWVLAAAGMLAVGIRRLPSGDAQSVQMVMLCASSLCYSLAYFLMTPACDFRYFYWSMTAVLAASLLHSDVIAAYLRRWLSHAQQLGDKAIKSLQDYS